MASEASSRSARPDKVTVAAPSSRAWISTCRMGRWSACSGKNGAGKSTLMDLVLGFAMPTEGTCRVFGEDSGRLSAASKARIGFVPQTDELMPLMTGAQHLALIASFHERWDRELIARLARDWEVPLDRRIGTMSGGERQKLATLMALGTARSCW